MGTIIPDPPKEPPPDVGDACALCFGPGKPLGPGATPKWIFVSLSGINKGPDWETGNRLPLNGDFELQQDSGDHCLYRLDIDDVSLGVWFKSPGVIVFVSQFGPGDIFQGLGENPCDTFVLNTITDFYIGGSAEIYGWETE